MAAPIPNSGYILHETIGKGGMGIVHRATNRLTGDVVALKQIRVAPDSLQFTQSASSTNPNDLRIAISQEFQLLAGLRHPYIINVIDYGFDLEKQPYFTMSYLPNAQTILEAGENLDNIQKLELIRQVLEAVSYLHRRGILHRDLKPSNILVVDGSARVLDFGLSVERNEKNQTTGGSILYLAPELLRREPATLESDLYAIGIIAFQLFADTHPFITYPEDFSNAVQTIEPDWSLLSIEPELRPVIQRLLAKKPEERFSHPEDCLVTINHVLGKTQEEESIRESFLQAATFVGREEEMARLTDALDSAREGHGSAWLIGGESGVGKSRLLRELQAKALVDGFIVLFGQGASDASMVPYQLWCNPLRNLLLMVDEVEESTSSVLKTLIPDIEKLLQRDIKPAPYMDRESAQVRLFDQIKRLFEQCDRPICLILEDIHWAGESLDLLPLLIQLASTRPLIIIATYRDDEAPALPNRFSDIHHLKLSRLSRRSLALLCESMLGDAGRNETLQELLLNETEGNAYFAVEMVRAWAEDAGRLQDIDIRSLPEHVFPDGIQSIVHRRIDRIPPAAQPYLRLAALVGRVVDLPLMRQMADGVDLDTVWLQTCADGAILEINNNVWQFSHDKIREAILAQLTEDERIAGHRCIATTIESNYSEDETYLTALPFHWGRAEEPEKERFHSIRAGDYLNAKYLEDVALAYYERAYDLLTPASTIAEQIEHVKMLNNLTRLVIDSSVQQQRAYDLAVEAERLAQSGWLAGEPYSEGIHISKLNQGNALLNQGRNREALSILYSLLEKNVFINAPQLHAKALYCTGKAHWDLGEFAEAEQLARDALAQAENANNLFGTLDACLLMGMVSEKLKRPTEEIVYEQKALSIARQLGTKRNEARVLYNHSVTLCRQGKIESAISYTQEALEIAIDIHNIQMEAITRASLIYYYRLHKEYDKAMEQFTESMTLLRGKELSQIEASCTTTIAHAMLDQDEPQRALEYLNQAIKLAESTDSKSYVPQIMQGFVRAYTALGDDEKAAQYQKLLDQSD